MTDEAYLSQAIQLAKQSTEPVGCGVVIVRHGGVIAQAFNSQRTDNIAINHAEIKAIIAANTLLGTRELAQAVAYCSSQPCAMCLTALSYAKVARIVFNKTMLDLFPDDPQSKLDSYEFIKHLNFVPKFEQLSLQ